MASALSRPTIALLREASGTDAEASLAPAFDANVAIREGKIAFTHPLLSFAAYSQASLQRRRELHRRLASLVTDPEERARHLAIAIEGPDEETALALEEGASGRIGGVRCTLPLSYVSGLVDSRLPRTPATFVDVERQRPSIASWPRIQLGPVASSRRSPSVRADPRRADLLRRIADAYMYGVDWGSSAEMYRRALDEEAADDVVRAKCEIGLAVTSQLLEISIDEIRRHARAAAEVAERVGDRSLLGEGLAIQACSELLLGRGRPWPLIERACALEPSLEARPLILRPELVACPHARPRR